MKWSWNLGRIAGITVRIHATFLLLLAWVGWSAYQAEGDVGAAVTGIVFILLLFGIVVLHELGHALTARRFGIPTKDITLLPIGGVARLERMPSKPRQELLVALAGPAVNVVLAALLYGVIRATGTPLIPDELATPGRALLAQLMWANVVLAVFNLLPAFPMDGGRALRAVLAMRMDPLRATQTAASLGQAMALLLGLLGLFGNPVLVFVALFVWMGAAAEAKMAQIKYALHGVPVRYAMVHDIQVLRPNEPLQRAIEHTLETLQPDFPVVDDGGRVVGVLTSRDLLRRLSEAGPGSLVAHAMHTKFAVAQPDEMLETVFERLGREEGHTVPVVLPDGRLVGIVTLEGIGELVMIQSALGQRAGNPKPPPMLRV